MHNFRTLPSDTSHVDQSSTSDNTEQEATDDNRHLVSLPLASIPTLDTPPVAAPSSIILPSNPSDVSSETFESIIHDYFPQKARHIQPEPFSNPGIIYPSSIRKVVPHLLSLLRILSKESLASAMLLLKAAER